MPDGRWSTRFSSAVPRASTLPFATAAPSTASRRSDARVRAIHLDVRNPADAREAAKIAGDVSLLVNNAGVLALGGPADVSLDQVRENMETNYFGTLNVITAFLPTLERNRGDRQHADPRRAGEHAGALGV